MNTKDRAPSILTGALHTARWWQERGWYAAERRDYSDGTVALIHRHHRTDAERVVVWDRRAGTTAGQVVRTITTAGHLGAAVRMWRNGCRSRYIGGAWITTTADGRVTV